VEYKSSQKQQLYRCAVEIVLTGRRAIMAGAWRQSQMWHQENQSLGTGVNVTLKKMTSMKQ
jgi:hypothetical protein